MQRDLSRNDNQRRDQATARWYQQAEKRKKIREEFENMVKIYLKDKHRKYQYSF